MPILLRRDPDSGYTYVDLYLDQGTRWVETVTRHVTDEDSPVIDATGYEARLTLRSTRGQFALELDADEIVNGGAAGTFSWDVPAGTMALLTEPVYDFELRLTPGGDDDEAFPAFKGRAIVRPMVVATVASS